MDKEKIILWKRRLLYFPRLFAKNEKILISLLLIAFLSSSLLLITSFVIKNTIVTGANGGTYREGLLKQPQLINPLYISNNDTDRDLINLIYSSLIRFNSKGEIIKDLADNWEVSADNKVFTFELNKNAKWHDGRELTADDVIFTVKAIQNPEYKSPQRPNWQGVNTEKINDYTVRFMLKQPYTAFFENAALPIMPKHIWENISPQNAVISDLNLKPIGSGKYKFYNFETSRQDSIKTYTLKSNKNYYKNPPRISTVQFFFYNSEEELIEALKKKDIDGINSISAKNKELLAKEEIIIYPLRLSRIFAIFLNSSKIDSFRDQNIRQALSLAIPRNELIKNALYEGAEEADSPLPSGALNNDATTKSRKETNQPNPLELLLKSGLKKADDGTLIKKTIKNDRQENTPFSIKLSTSDIPELRDAAEFIKKKWEDLGIKVEIILMNVVDLEKDAIRPRNYEALLFGEVYGHEPEPFSFWHSSQIRDPGLNIAMFSNSKTDKLLEDAMRDPNPETRKEKYLEFENIVQTGIGAIFLYTPHYFYGVRSFIKGIEVQNIVVPSDRFNEVENWYIKTKRIWKD
ncbi:MAG: hypothetical protein A3G49_03770 [Candidatus Sungbacteria bacterium RIFCSPLOWO2_12_FULL_41_11]|uniref:Solute-binding protein family 5 domain-containing protein n=1 Tax=Candidatus Sungbacteria bacterium RIFCSPLOWO2_12_FULL_41_11 TaxID=1802286 RepID=A0A1G2LMN3_9BACT|nr:MAG: Extracellular solute-binding protein [Parcubacteria group bacterium GW2011_GWA2_42_14]OGZ98774.1 MAG: hypothetical protein A3D41_03435 [Candidatus Sungbacteria bacterium RIFCSPHIGHO2_02_FULL_41_12b]OHA12876.1 MAG: hypothetical protein A3G49_03770 [Candidatus Sungbacteria bacterium RIFCSPLOWO2_12_FULL_41_11]